MSQTHRVWLEPYSFFFILDKERVRQGTTNLVVWSGDLTALNLLIVILYLLCVSVHLPAVVQQRWWFILNRCDVRGMWLKIIIWSIVRLASHHFCFQSKQLQLRCLQLQQLSDNFQARSSYFWTRMQSAAFPVSIPLSGSFRSSSDTRACMFMCGCVCLCVIVCLWLCVNIYVCMYECILLSVSVYMYVCASMCESFVGAGASGLRYCFQAVS